MYNKPAPYRNAAKNPTALQTIKFGARCGHFVGQDSILSRQVKNLSYIWLPPKAALNSFLFVHAIIEWFNS